MKLKLKKSTKNFLLELIPYTLVAAVVLAVAIFGSIDKKSSTSSLNLAYLDNDNFTVSSDQLSEMYVVASMSDSMNLATTDVVSNNYVIVSVMRDVGQSASANTSSVQKPTVVDTSNLTRGVFTYTVKAGDTMDKIIEQLRKERNNLTLTKDQIRWSNKLKTTNLNAGQVLYLPSTSGIVYTVKAGDTVNSIASRYSSPADQIISYNDLENAGLVVGERIVLPNGVLPERERPEYVAPVVRTYTYTYTYSGMSRSRLNLRVVGYMRGVSSPGNPGVPGQCTWYAWYWRATDPKSLGRLPGGLHNARDWVGQLRAQGYRVDHTPQVGAVFHTYSGYYGHVGVVTAINADGTITVREMNLGVPYRVTEAEIPANLIGTFNYIH